jgi:hypothetical protein
VSATLEAARQGFVEILCDLVSVHIFGPAALAATLEFAARFAMDISPLQSSNYPPWRYRLRKMLQRYDSDLNNRNGTGYPNSKIKAFVEWLKTGHQLTAGDGDIRVIDAHIVTREAYQFISDHWDETSKKVLAMLPKELAKPYLMHERHDLIAKMIERLRYGVPPNEICHLSKQPACFQDILTAGWAYKIDQIANNPSWGSPDEYNLLFRLILKACESSYVHSEWGKRIIAEEQ